MSSATIRIASDFSRFPSGRTDRDSKFSAESFLRKLLLPALIKYDHIIIDLDGTVGYGSSFLEETFGGLVRKFGYDPVSIRSKIKLESYDQSLIDEIWSYVSFAA